MNTKSRRILKPQPLSHNQLIDMIDVTEYGIFWKLTEEQTHIPGKRGRKPHLPIEGHSAIKLNWDSTVAQYRPLIHINNGWYDANRIIWFYATGVWPANKLVCHVDRDWLNLSYDNLYIKGVGTLYELNELNNHNKKPHTWFDSLIIDPLKWLIQDFNKDNHRFV